MEQTANIVSFPGLGWEFEIDRVAFHIGSLPVYWYGILIALGFILAILYVTKRAKEFGVDPDWAAPSAASSAQEPISCCCAGTTTDRIWTRFLIHAAAAWQSTAV